MNRKHKKHRERRRTDGSEGRESALLTPQESPSEELFNRELSWLQFNSRVLSEAEDPENPLLERVRFLTIFASNLDEFFMNRVGDLKMRLQATRLSPQMEPAPIYEQLAEIRRIVLAQVERTSATYEDLMRRLEDRDIRIVKASEMTREEREVAFQYFQNNIFPVLTPQAVDPGKPFPFISNLSHSLGVRLSPPDREEQLFARVKLPPLLPQLMRLSPVDRSDRLRFVSTEEIVRENLSSLFPGMTIENVMPFRITRSARVDSDIEETDDLLEFIKEELRERRFAPVVRLEFSEPEDPWILEFLQHETEVSTEDTYPTPCVEWGRLRELIDAGAAELKFSPWSPVSAPQLSDEEVSPFAAIAANDILVHHPYESFSGSVEHFIRSAIDDPKVVAIKMTLYRTGDRSPIVPLLIRAVEQGKHVVCLIELKAHFDEARNIRWAEELEESGVHVMYGVVGLKTHAKLILVARQENDGVRCYAHIGTGNYNPTTARLYTDLGLFTADKNITHELIEVFNFLTGRSLKKSYDNLIVAPFNIRERFLHLVSGEIEHAKAGRPAHIILKMNGLEDAAMIKALYRASCEGVRIDLIVRGVCRLKPGGPGLSENITVVSVIGRFLEHSRIFYFRTGAAEPLDGSFFIGSADWMYRNLSRRVEVVTPIRDKLGREKCYEILQLLLNDRRLKWTLRPDGTYLRSESRSPFGSGSQEELMRLAKERARAVFEPPSAPRTDPPTTLPSTT